MSDGDAVALLNHLLGCSVCFVDSHNEMLVSSFGLRTAVDQCDLSLTDIVITFSLSRKTF